MNTNVFHDNAPQYWASGLPVIPLRKRSKAPLLKDWRQFASDMPSEAARELWLNNYPQSNVGLPFGPASGLCAIDVDTDDEELVKAIEDCLPVSPWRRVGKKGYAAVYRWQGQRACKIKGEQSMVCELLSEGNQLVLPPSIHPDTGQPYVANTNLWEVMDDIPALGVDIEQRLREALAAKGVGAVRRSHAGNAKPVAVSGPRLYGDDGMERWVSDKLNEAVAEISSTPSGDRNNTLYWCSRRMAEHVAAAGLDWEVAAKALGDAAVQAGLTPAETRATMESGHETGSKNPTDWIPVANQYVYRAAQEVFYHVESRTPLKETGFNGLHGHLYTDKGRFSTFLLSNAIITKVGDTIYEPGIPDRIVADGGMEYLNIYRPSDVVAQAGDATPYVEFLEGLVPDVEQRQHLLKWMAHIVRKPGKKVRHAILLRSNAQGIGKTVAFEILGNLVGLSNVRKTDSAEISGKWRSYLIGATLVVVEEFDLGNGAGFYNTLKEVITGTEANVEEKFCTARMVSNHASFVFLTNRAIPVLMEANDRRFHVIDTPAKPRDAEYYRQFATWWRESLGVIRHYLDGIDLSDFDPDAPPPMTKAKEHLIVHGEDDTVVDLRELIEGRVGCFAGDLVTHKQVQLQLGFPGKMPDGRSVIRALNDVGAVPIGQVRVGDRRQSYWALRNTGFWTRADNESRAQEIQHPGRFEVANDMGLEIDHLMTLPYDYMRYMAGPG